MADAQPAPQRWLFSPLPDLLLGCGVAYALVFLLHAVVGEQMRQWFPPGLMPLLILFSGVPHYGATLLRVYDRREDRRAYAIFALFLTVAVWSLFALGLHVVAVGSWFITVYFTWSPWHYAGQNYGIAMMFLRRRGVEVTERARKLVHASFMLSYLLAVFALHGELAGGNYAPVLYEETVFEIIRLNISAGVLRFLVPLTVAAYVGSLAGAAVLLLRKASPRDLVPSALLAASQALWFSVPMLARYGGFFQNIEPLSHQQAGYIFLWVGIAHSVQYLWVTTYFAAHQSETRRHAPYLLKTLLAGAAIWVVPTFIFAPQALGRIPYDAGMALMVAAAVNIHHFMLDGVIWKLRHHRIARILIRDRQDDALEPGGPGSGWLRPAIWAVGIFSVGLWIFEILQLESYRKARDKQDVEKIEAVAKRLETVSRGSAAVRLGAAELRAESGDLDLAISHVETALTHKESPKAWATLGALCQAANQGNRAIEACRKALRLDPDSAGAMVNLALYLAMNRWGDSAAATEAIEIATTAARNTENGDGAEAELHVKALNALALANASAGHVDPAWTIANQAMVKARALGSVPLVAAVQRTLDLFEAGSPEQSAGATGPK